MAMGGFILALTISNLANLTNPYFKSSIAYTITQIFGIIFSISNLLVGWFLIKIKRWAYNSALMLMIFVLGVYLLDLMDVMTLMQHLNSDAIVDLGLSTIILILLIVSKTKFTDERRN